MPNRHPYILNIKKIGIYCFINTHNGKRYVGQSINIDVRHKRHLIDLNKNTHPNAHLQGAFNKYGSSCFEFHILEECGADMLDMREIAWINYYHSFGEGGYNLTSGGLFFKHTWETKKKIGAAEIGRKRNPISDEARLKMRLAKLGRKLSPEHKKKIGAAAKGKKRAFSPEWIANIGAAQTKRYKDNPQLIDSLTGRFVPREKSLTLQNN